MNDQNAAPMSTDETRSEAVTPATNSAEAAAYAWIKERIRRGYFRPGARLRAEEIAEAVGVSRMPVREALRRLDSEGLVTLRLNRGAIVAGYSHAEIVELFEMRAMLEGLAARRAAPHLGGPQIAALEAMLERMLEEESQSEVWMQRHWEFHRYILDLSGGQYIAREVERLYILLEPYLRIWLLSTEKPVSAHEEHSALLGVLRNQDPVASDRAMREHVLSTAPQVVAQLSAAPD